LARLSAADEDEDEEDWPGAGGRLRAPNRGHVYSRCGAGRSRGSRIQNPKKKPQKKTLFSLNSSCVIKKLPRVGNVLLYAQPYLASLGTSNASESVLRVYLRPTNGSCYCSCSRLPAVTKRAPPPPQDGSLAADGGSEIDERPLSPLIFPDQVSVTLLRSLDRTA
jgi:hypothetical protein